MSRLRIYPKVANDMFFTQGSWAMTFLGIMLIIQMVKMVTSLFNGSDLNSYYAATFIASNIFMLVIGIISPIGFIPHFVSHGVTRKDYFKGTVLGTIGLALAIPIISAVVSSILSLIEKLLNLSLSMVPFEGKDIAEEGNLIADIILSIIFTPYVDLGSNWLLALFVFALNIFTYYVAGWFIGSAFCRLGILGILSIPAAFILIFVEDLFISISLGLPVPSFAESLEIPFIFSLAVIWASIAIVCWGIRQLTKRISVK